MSVISTFSDIEWAQQLAAERVRREQAEAELAQVRARLAALEAPAVAPFHALHAQIGALVHHLRLGVVLVDGSGQIQYVSPHFWRMFGLEPAAGPPPFAPGQLLIDAAFADPAAFQTRVRALHVAGKTALGEAFRLRDGRRLVLDYFVLDEAGAGRLICYRDVTRAHQRITRMRTLAYIPEQNPNPVFRLTTTGETVYANSAARAVLSALAADPAGRHCVLTLARAALNTPGQSPPTEMALAGRHYQLVAAAVPGQAYATLYLTDITARHRAGQELAQQREFYESVLAQVPIAVGVFDDEHRYLFVNSSCEPDPALRAWMRGKTSAEVSAQCRHPADSAPRRSAAFAEVMRTGREVQWEETLPVADGTDCHFALRYLPVRGLAGTPLVISLGIDLTERKRAEQRVIQQQEFYESILNLLPFDVAVFDAEHRFRFVNVAAVSDAAVRQQIIGLTNTEYFARYQLQYPEMGQQREQYFDLAVRTRTDVTWEEMRTSRKGRPQLMMRYLRPVSGPTGELRLVVGAGIDITARYLAENLQQQVQDMLRDQESFIRQIVDALPSVLYLAEPGWKIAFANRAYYERVNNSAHLMGTEPKSEVVAREVADMVALSREVLRTGQPTTREMSLQLHSGEQQHHQVYMQPLRGPNGQMSVLTISTDVTEVKRARQELERREKQYHDLVHYSQALICTHDLQGLILTVNPAVEQLLDWPAAELVGHSLGNVLPPKHLPDFEEHLAALATQHPQDKLLTVCTRTGERRYLRCYSYPVVETGYAPYVVASAYDVTDGLLAQRALEQAKQEADANAQAKEAFLARMSHEIRTPLNGVLGMAGLLQKTPLTATQREYLDAMQHAGRHLLVLLNDVLDMAKITAHHLHLNQAPFDAALALTGAGQAVAAQVAEKGLTLVVEALPPDLPRVLGDAYRLHQVLLNLLSNALKFTQSGTIRLGAVVCPGGPTELVLRFWVQDTGIGMTPEEQAHIFEAFAQANTETSRRFGGTGLGLSISQQLVAQMGGTLRVCSEPGQGTAFSFQLTLPQVPADEAPANQSEPSESGQSAPPVAASYEGLRGLRVLLAEDNLVNQWIAVVVLEHWGVQVQAVSNGPDALARLQNERFDVAILDIRMPGLSGVEVTQAIRRHPDAAHANIPIMALTANAFEPELAAYLAAGMTACLTKPYEEADLCQLLLDLAPNPQ